MLLYEDILAYSLAWSLDLSVRFLLTSFVRNDRRGMFVRMTDGYVRSDLQEGMSVRIYRRECSYYMTQTIILNGMVTGSKAS